MSFTVFDLDAETRLSFVVNELDRMGFSHGVVREVSLGSNNRVFTDGESVFVKGYRGPHAYGELQFGETAATFGVRVPEMLAATDELGVFEFLSLSPLSPRDVPLLVETVRAMHEQSRGLVSEWSVDWNAALAGVSAALSSPESGALWGGLLEVAEICCEFFGSLNVSDSGLVFSHYDLSVPNCGVLGDGSLVVCDWELARFSLPELDVARLFVSLLERGWAVSGELFELYGGLDAEVFARAVQWRFVQCVAAVVSVGGLFEGLRLLSLLGGEFPELGL